METKSGTTRMGIGWICFFLSLLLGLATPVQARSPDLSLWTRDISGFENEGEERKDFAGQVAVSGTTIHTLWTSEGADYARTLYYRRSTDNGATFEDPIMLFAPMNLNYLLGNQDYSRLMAVDGQTVHVVFSQFHDDGWHYTLRYLRSTDGGATFEPVRVLFTGPDVYHVRYPNVVAEEGKVTIVFSYDPNWYDAHAIMVFQSLDNGSTFTLSDPYGSTSHYGQADEIVRCGDQICILRRQFWGSYDSRSAILCSSDGGVTYQDTWLSTVAADGHYSAGKAHNVTYTPNMAIDGGTIHVVWEQNDCGYWNTPPTCHHVYYSRSTDNGLTFSAPAKLSAEIPAGTVLVDGSATIAAKGGTVYVLFHDTGAHLYLKRSLNGGATFNPLQNPGYAWYPMIQPDPADPTGAKAHLVAVNWDYLRTQDQGATFTINSRLFPVWSTVGSGTSRPAMAIGPDSVLHLLLDTQYLSQGKAWDPDVFYRNLQPAPNPGVENRQLRLFGDDVTQQYDTMVIPAGPDTHFTTAMTLQAWVKINTSRVGRAGYFVTQETAVGVQLGKWDSEQADGRIRTTGGNYTLIGGDPLPQGVWKHLAMTYDSAAGADNFRLYLDGELVGVTTATGEILMGAAPLLIGGGKSLRFYDDLTLDDLRLWDRALTQQELQASLPDLLDADEPGLVAWYTFDDTTRDMTGRGNDGILLYRERFVSEIAPVCQFTGQPLSGNVPLTVQFTDGSQGVVDAWAWDFGDGGTSTEQNPSHIYDTAGTYTVCLTVTNGYGSDTETKAGYITVTSSDCVAEQSLKTRFGKDKEAAEQALGTLRAFRQGPLSASGDGQAFVAMYARHTQEVSRILSTTRTLGGRVADLLARAASALAGGDKGLDPIIPSGLRDDIEGVLKTLRALGSPTLRADLDKVLTYLATHTRNLPGDRVQILLP